MSVAIAEQPINEMALGPASEAGPAPKRIVVAYGFWIFLLSDIVMFSALFAAYAVLKRATAGGPTGAQLFNQVSVALETAFLLASSYACGLMSLAISSKRRVATYWGAAVTFVLGAAFLGLEIREFANMIAQGATPQRSAFLSAFFALVGCHGLHVTGGLIAFIFLLARTAMSKFTPAQATASIVVSYYWHFVDIVWIALFTVIYFIR